MPANDSKKVMQRQWELLHLLPTTGAGKTVTELTKELCDLGFTIGNKQVERDLKDLQFVMAIECNATGKPYGWRWIKGASRHAGAMSLAEALSWQMMSDMLTPLLPKVITQALTPHFSEATKKLKQLSETHNSSHWHEKIRVVAPSLPFVPPIINEEVLEKVHEALLHHKQLEVGYLSVGSDVAKTMTLHPLGLIQRGAVSYLVATAFRFTEPRLFALHRLSDVKLNSHTANIPPNFKLDEYVNSGALSFGSGELIQLELRVTNRLALILQESALATDQHVATIANSMDVFIKATLAHTWQLEWWILSKSTEIEVLKPLELRKSIKNQLKNALAMYE